MILKANPVITITEAKKLLGDEAEELSDEEIQQMVDDFDIIAQFAIKLVQNMKAKNNKTD